MRVTDKDAFATLFTEKNPDCVWIPTGKAKSCVTVPPESTTAIGADAGGTEIGEPSWDSETSARTQRWSTAFPVPAVFCRSMQRPAPIRAKGGCRKGLYQGQLPRER